MLYLLNPSETDEYTALVILYPRKKYLKAPDTPYLFIIFSLLVSPAQETFELGYSWPGDFLLGASGRTGRFFIQLLFHNPISLTDDLTVSLCNFSTAINST